MIKLFRKQIPSTHTMWCFEVSARHLSFTLAAEELNITQSAVSKQVALLENSLQVKLFIRVRQRLELSPAGKIYLRKVTKILDLTEQSSREMLCYGHYDEVINIASHPTFCAHWLIPALKGLLDENVHLQLNFYDYLEPMDMQNSNIDVAFLYGAGHWHSVDTLELFKEKMVPICTPNILKEYPDPDDVTIYLENRLIQNRSGMGIWDCFFTRFNIINTYPYRGSMFETWSACISAAKEGYGIALVPHFLVEEFLLQGQLVLASSHVLDNLGSYYIAYLKKHSAEPKVIKIISWILNYIKNQAL